MKKVALLNRTKSDIFIQKWNKVYFKMTIHAQRVQDTDLQQLCKNISQIPKAVLLALSKFWVKRSKIRHSIAFCEWRRDFMSNLSGQSLEELDEIIETKRKYIDDMNVMSKTVVKKYKKDNINALEHELTPISLIKLKSILLGKNTYSKNNYKPPFFINGLRELGMYEYRFNVDDFKIDQLQKKLSRRQSMVSKQVV